MNAPKLLKVVPIEGVFPRYMIEDQNHNTWDGKSFVSDKKKALIYADTEQACEDLQDIIKKDLRERTLIRFQAPVMIEVYADPDAIVNPLEIAEWLTKTCRLQMNTTENGLGPNNAVVLPAIHFYKIEESHDET